jgi:hypothetical protein
MIMYDGTLQHVQLAYSGSSIQRRVHYRRINKIFKDHFTLTAAPPYVSCAENPLHSQFSLLRQQKKAKIRVKQTEYEWKLRSQLIWPWIDLYTFRRSNTGQRLEKRLKSLTSNAKVDLIGAGVRIAGHVQGEYLDRRTLFYSGKCTHDSGTQKSQLTDVGTLNVLHKQRLSLARCLFVWKIITICESDLYRFLTIDRGNWVFVNIQSRGYDLKISVRFLCDLA